MNDTSIPAKVHLHGKGLARRVERGHRWIFSNEVDRLEGDPQPGGPVEVFSARGRFLGTGSWSPHSLIRVRIWSPDRVTVDAAWIRDRLTAAIQCRRELFHTEPEACRLVFGEGDGLPGLVVDCFGPVLAVQFQSAGAELWRDSILDLLEEALAPAAIVERSDTPSRDHEGLPRRSGVVRGQLEGDPVTFVDARDGLTYLAPVLTGQKTGFFFDQWINRKAFREVAAGRRVLDAFCYTGAWGASAAAGGAKSVRFLDSSGPSLALAERQWEANGFDCPAEFVQASAFDELKALSQAGESFDLIALDPPAFAKSRKHVKEAIKGYREINLRAMRLLAPGGEIFTCSCSHHITSETFHETVAAAAANSGRSFVVVRELVQSPDHPVVLGMPETRYLKGLHLRRMD